MARIATPRFASDYDEKYHRHLKQILSEKPNNPYNQAKIHIGSLEQLYELEKTTPLNKMPRRHRAQNLLCYRLNNAAWYADQSRRQYLKVKCKNDSWHNCERQIAQIALYGEINDNAPMPSFRTIENWFENFDLPSIETIKIKSQWHTLEEWLLIIQHYEIENMPKTMHQMRKYVSQLVYSKDRDFYKKIL